MRTDQSPTSVGVQTETTAQRERPAQASTTNTSPDAPVISVADQERVALLPENASNQFRARWETIQGEFVDDPRRAVEEAGALAMDALKQVSAVFDEKRQQLQRGTEISTEDLRQTLRRYRLLLNRLL